MNNPHRLPILPLHFGKNIFHITFGCFCFFPVGKQDQVWHLPYRETKIYKLPGNNESFSP